MSSVTQKLASAFSLHNTQRSAAVQRPQQSHPALAQRPAAARITGSDTLQTVAQEQGEPTLDLVQGEARPTSSNSRFRAFSRLPLFSRNAASSRKSLGQGAASSRISPGQAAESIEMVGLSGQRNAPQIVLEHEIPHTSPGSLEQDINQALAAGQAHPSGAEGGSVSGAVVHRLRESQGEAAVTLSLDAHGKPQITAPALRHTLLKQTLGQATQHYQSAVSSASGEQHALLEESGRLLALHSSPESLVGVSGSAAKPEWKHTNAVKESPWSGTSGKAALSHRLALDAAENEVSVSRTDTPAMAVGRMKLPDATLLGQISGIYPERTDAGKQSWRVHEGKLYRLNDHQTGWQPASLPGSRQHAAQQGESDEEKSYGQLSRQGDNQLYCVYDDRQLHNVSTSGHSEPLEDKISKVSVAEEGQTLLLLKNEKTHQQSIKLLPQPDASVDSHRTLSVSPPDTRLAALAQTAQHIIAADYQGKIRVASRPGPEQSDLDFAAVENRSLQQHLHDQIKAVVGDRFHLEDILNGENGQLHAVVKDGADRQHAIALNTSGSARQAPSHWNLSDSMVMNYQKGLPVVTPSRHEIVDLGTGGHLALKEGKVHFFNGTTQSWEASDVKADQLRLGQDRQAWVLKDNELKRLKINVSSNKINADRNVFALPQVKKSVSDDLALPGINKDNTLTSAAVLDNGRFITLDEGGDLRLHHVNGETRRDIRLPVTLSRASLNQAIQQAIRSHSPAVGTSEEQKVMDVAIGPGRNLFLLTDRGEMYRVPEQSWMKGNMAQMRQVQLSAKPAKLYNDRNNHLMLELDNGKLLSLRDDLWHPVAAVPTSPANEVTPPGGKEKKNMADKHYGRLMSATRDSRLGRTGMTYKREVNTFGQTGHDGHKVHTPFRTRLSTFVFRPTLQTPRPLKNLSYLVQHGHRGRNGLAHIYELQSDQLTQLNQHLEKPAAGQGPAEPLSLKLKTLAGQGDLPAWFEDMQKFSVRLADSSGHKADQLNQHYSQQGEVKKQLNNLTGSLNPAMTRDGDLTAKLKQIFSRYPTGKGNTALLALAALEENGVKLSHQKASEAIPLGHRRDKHDEMGLAKSRLIIDGLAHVKMHDLIDRLTAATALPEAEKRQALTAIETDFHTLYQDWDNNPLRQVTSFGYNSISALEASYDAVKSLTKAFAKENHSINVTARTVMHAKDQSVLAQKLEDTVRSMEKGESLSFSRSYGAATTVSGIPGTQVIAGVGGRGSLDRTYNLSFTRGEGGVNVSFGRDGGGTFTPFVGMGYNLLTDYLETHKTHLDDRRDLAPAARLGAVVSVTPLDIKKQNGVSFDITDAELPHFIAGLTEGTLDPLALINRGNQHSVKQGNVMNVSLDVNAAALASVGFPLTDKNAGQASASSRIGGGAYVGVNLMSGTRERGRATTEESTTLSQSNNRLRGLNKASVGANVALPIGTITKSDEGRFALFAGPAATFQLSIDDRTRQSLSLQTKRAQLLEPVHMAKLMESLGKSFSDPETSALLASLKNDEESEPQQASAAEDRQSTARTARQKLNALDVHFESRRGEEGTNGQKAALRELDKHLRQQYAAERGLTLLQNGEYQTTYANTSKVDNNGLWHQFSHWLDGELNASNATRIRQLMTDDHRLQTLIARLKDNVSTDATVTLELKNDVRERLEQRWLKEGIGADELTAELTDRNNLRLKAIGFSKGQSKSDGFSTPAFLLGGGNSAAVAMKRNLGKINFSYGEDEDKPTGYTLDGRIAKINDELAAALLHGQQAHYQLKS